MSLFLLDLAAVAFVVGLVVCAAYWRNEHNRAPFKRRRGR